MKYMKIYSLNKIGKFILMISIILFTIFLNGCVNPAKDVPIIKVNVTYSEREGIVEADTYSFVQDNVSYINRPKKTVADSFPAIIGRATINKKIIKDNEKVNETIIGPWEAVTYKGDGSYSFDLGFHEGNYPEPGDQVHISIIVVDNKGERIGYIVADTIWK